MRLSNPQQDTNILLRDEPTAGLDSASRRHTREILAEQTAQRDTAVAGVAHCRGVRYSGRPRRPTRVRTDNHSPNRSPVPRTVESDLTAARRAFGSASVRAIDRPTAGSRFDRRYRRTGVSGRCRDPWGLELTASRADPAPSERRPASTLRGRTRPPALRSAGGVKRTPRYPAAWSWPACSRWSVIAELLRRDTSLPSSVSHRDRRWRPDSDAYRGRCSRRGRTDGSVGHRRGVSRNVTSGQDRPEARDGSRYYREAVDTLTAAAQLAA